jgi:metal-responsive CopG/Arc/MetJ family transcriptional regulator
MRATPEELQVIDRLVDDTGAASRSELISVAVEAYLL